MIKPFKTILNAKKILPTLRQEQKKPMVELIQSFESMLEQKYFTKSIEVLILASIEKSLLDSEVYAGKEIPLSQIHEKFKTDIKYGADFKMAEIIAVLKSHEQSVKLKNGTFEKSCVNKDFTDFEPLLKKTLSEFKMSLYWEEQQP
tara:strand:+ start:95 stop:532 length:438 start_codon:yes stop_codon:yes gene_type:complete